MIGWGFHSVAALLLLLYTHFHKQMESRAAASEARLKAEAAVALERLEQNFIARREDAVTKVWWEEGEE